MYKGWEGNKKPTQHVFGDQILNSGSLRYVTGLISILSEMFSILNLRECQS